MSGDSSSVVFSWRAEHMQELLASCDRDEVTPLLFKYFPTGSRLLESGCGAGRYVKFLHDRGMRITGLEVSAETVRMVKRAWPELDIVQGDAAKSPFDETSFDGVISLGVVEHWPEGPSRPLADLFRVLKPGGYAVVTVPCHNTLRRLKRMVWWDEVVRLPAGLARAAKRRRLMPMTRLNKDFKYPVYPTYGPFHEYRMTCEQFAAEVRGAGFEIVEHIPIALMDGICHEVNPLGLLVAFKSWEFRPTRLARSLDRVFAKRPFFHAHMQAIVARRPQNAA